jgi:hypothetical protein
MRVTQPGEPVTKGLGVVNSKIYGLLPLFLQHGQDLKYPIS